jgi:hypothetical protein
LQEIDHSAAPNAIAQGRDAMDVYESMRTPAYIGAER